MTCGDLFAGIGGMSLGLERAGFTVRWQVEREPYCENVLARHWPHVARRRDVRFANASNLKRVDLIAGGFPCQDISAAGKGAGIGGHRSGLWREFARIVGELRPRWVLVENVPALRGRGADIVLGDLEAEGYACWPLVVGARHAGAPHRRDRVWIVGRVADAGCWSGNGIHEREQTRYVAPEPQLAGGGSDCGSSPGSGVADGHDEGRQSEWAGGVHTPQRDASRDDADRCDEGMADAEGCGRAPEGQRWGAQESVVVGWPSRPGEPQHEWEPPRTVESPLGRAAHGVSARLAGTRWRNELKALGNSVVPQVVEVIGRAILAVDAP